MAARLVSLGDHPNIAIVDVLTVIGRNRLCNARVDSGRVSRRHCCLALNKGELIVRDLSSTNGTFINGVRVDCGLLRPADELSIANLRYRLEIESNDRDSGERSASDTFRGVELKQILDLASRETVHEGSALDLSRD
jgi:pSer/pThr/pTyr-binding forkhead associated (FHA) protein